MFNEIVFLILSKSLFTFNGWFFKEWLYKEPAERCSIGLRSTGGSLKNGYTRNQQNGVLFDDPPRHQNKPDVGWLLARWPEWLSIAVVSVETCDGVCCFFTNFVYFLSKGLQSSRPSYSWIWLWLRFVCEVADSLPQFLSFSIVDVSTQVVILPFEQLMNILLRRLALASGVVPRHFGILISS